MFRHNWMREDLLHFVWKYKGLPTDNLKTSGNDSISVVDSGVQNFLSGPDFFNAKIQIGSQLWAGNVEVHIKSSDWYRHNHEKDTSYNNVILHVVWEDDVPVFRSNNEVIPTLQLKDYISPILLNSYQTLLNQKKKRFINCEKDLKDIDNFLWKHWLERLYFERLEQKSELVLHLLKESKNDWEKVTFALLFKNFGSNINGDSFLSIANRIDISVIRKLQHDPFQLESLFFGMAGLLEDETIHDSYYLALEKEYHYLKRKFGLDSTTVQKPDFFKLRPPNFPTIRLSQLANLLSLQKNIFSKIIEINTLKDVHNLFKVAASPYWETHFNFGKISKGSKKGISKNFIDILTINTIIPLKFCYHKHLGKDINEEIIEILQYIKREHNSLIVNYESFGAIISDAKDSQACITLYNTYCKQNKCLQCAIGKELLTRKA